MMPSEMTAVDGGVVLKKSWTEALRESSPRLRKE